MTVRRVVIDGVIVAAALGLLAAPHLPSGRKTRPYVPRSRLVASAPGFGWQTNRGVACATVTLTLSNAGPTDLECDIDFFDCRSGDEPESYRGPGGISLRSRAASNLTFVAPCASRAPGSRVCCYSVRWQQSSSWLERTEANHPALEQVLRRGRLQALWQSDDKRFERAREQGLVFNSNIGVGEYFRLAHGLDYPRWRAEEESEARVIEASRKEYDRLRLQWFERYWKAEPRRPREEEAWRAAGLEKGRQTALAMGQDALMASRTAEDAMLWWAGAQSRTDRQRARIAFESWWYRAGGKHAEQVGAE